MSISKDLPDNERYCALLKLLDPNFVGIVDERHHLGPTGGITSRTRRVQVNGENLIQKEYLAGLENKTQKELMLLFASSSAEKNDKGPNQKGLKRAAGYRNLSSDSQLGTQLFMKNYGLDLDDWAFLLLQAKCPSWDTPHFHLAIWRSVLEAMKELHGANFVQVDVRSDNICVAAHELYVFSPPDGKQMTMGKFDLTKLTLIDLGEALHPEYTHRSIYFNGAGIPLYVRNSYVSPNYLAKAKLVTKVDNFPLHSLDWRIDFFAIGCMIEDWHEDIVFSEKPPRFLKSHQKKTYKNALALLKALPGLLRNYDTDPAKRAAVDPHDAVIAQIDAVINITEWQTLDFSLPASIGSVTPPKPVTHTSIPPRRAATTILTNASTLPTEVVPDFVQKLSAHKRKILLAAVAATLGGALYWQSHRELPPKSPVIVEPKHGPVEADPAAYKAFIVAKKQQEGAPTASAGVPQQPPAPSLPVETKPSPGRQLAAALAEWQQSSYGSLNWENKLESMIKRLQDAGVEPAERDAAAITVQSDYAKQSQQVKGGAWWLAAKPTVTAPADLAWLSYSRLLAAQHGLGPAGTEARLNVDMAQAAGKAMQGRPATPQLAARQQAAHQLVLQLNSLGDLAQQPSLHPAATDAAQFLVGMWRAGARSGVTLEPQATFKALRKVADLPAQNLQIATGFAAACLLPVPDQALALRYFKQALANPVSSASKANLAVLPTYIKLLENKDFACP